MKDLSAFGHLSSPLQKVELSLCTSLGIELFLKRDDLLDPLISGNKWRKLKYNLYEMQTLRKETLITFGGAYSNHVHAVAEAGARFDFKTVGIIRGERAKTPSSTLLDCEKKGMALHFVSRESYRSKEQSEEVKSILHMYTDFFLLPEGGANALAQKGCSEIINEIQIPYDYFCLACGTGTTWAGLTQTCPTSVKLLGFSVLRGAEQSSIEAVTNSQLSTSNCQLVSDYHFGGYAKHTPELLDFITSFEKETAVKIEQVYTGKLLFGILDLAKKGFFPKGSRIVALHTGGLQGRLPLLDEGQDYVST